LKNRENTFANTKKFLCPIFIETGMKVDEVQGITKIAVTKKLLHTLLLPTQHSYIPFQ
jgi:hypothetical protein